MKSELFLDKNIKHKLEKKLKPCPFCGWNTIILTYELIPNVCCVRCNGSMRGYLDINETVKMWNKRKKESWLKKLWRKM